MTRRFFAFAIVCVVPLAASGLTIHVPDQATTIQSAIHQASPSEIDTVQVAAGTYHERPYIIGKNVVLRGSGADVTTLDGDLGGNVRTISFVSRACIVEDFTITGGEQATGDSVGAGIYINQASPTVRRCRLIGNLGRAGGGLAVYVYSEPKIESCWVAYNNGGGIYVETGPIDMGTSYAEIIDTAIVRNGGIGVNVFRGARARLTNCTIAYNAADGLRTDQYGRVAMSNCIIAFNGGAGINRYDPTACLRPLTCNNVYGNPAGNYRGISPGDACFPGRGSGDVSFDPCFQNVSLDNFHLQLNSPLCLLQQPGACGRLGAYSDPCASGSGSCVVFVEASTWGLVKQRYR